MGYRKSREENDWIEYIVDRTYMFYAGRQIIIWGRNQVSEDIRVRLKEKYGTDVAFYIDRDERKIDNTNVFPINILGGGGEKSFMYYVVIPMVFYKSAEDELIRWGYKKEIDYFCFHDCVVSNEEDYYEDKHGNKVIGRNQGIQLVFSGFHSQIIIGENVRFLDTSLYIHSNASVLLGDNSCIKNLDMQIDRDANIEIEEGSTIEEDISNKEIWTVGENSRLIIGKYAFFNNISMCINSGSEVFIGNSSRIQNLSIWIDKCATVELKDRVKVEGNIYSNSDWTIEQESIFNIGSDSILLYGTICMCANTVLKVGKNCIIGKNYRIDVLPYTEILIGDDCLFSWDVGMMSSDAHSIFDVATGENINSTKKIHKTRKIVIGNHVWIGMRVVILYNAEIHDGSIVGASSLVKGVIPNNCIAAGLPAKVVRRNVAWCFENCADNIVGREQKYVNYTI